MSSSAAQEGSQLSNVGHSEIAVSDPTPSSSISQNRRPDVDELYRLKLSGLVKSYKNAQARSAVSLGVLEINVSAFEDFRKAVFDVASQHVQGIAIPENQSFSMRNEPPSIDDLDLIVSFKHRNHFYSIESNFIASLALDLFKAILRYVYFHSAELDGSRACDRFPYFQIRNQLAGSCTLC